MFNLGKTLKPCQRSFFLRALRTIPSLALIFAFYEALYGAPGHNQPLAPNRTTRLTFVLGELLILVVAFCSILQLCYSGHIFGFQIEFVFLLTRVFIPTGLRWQVWHWQNRSGTGSWHDLIGQTMKRSDLSGRRRGQDIHQETQRAG